jgi:hypothetical protein
MAHKCMFCVITEGEDVSSGHMSTGHMSSGQVYTFYKSYCSEMCYVTRDMTQFCSSNKIGFRFLLLGFFLSFYVSAFIMVASVEIILLLQKYVLRQRNLDHFRGAVSLKLYEILKLYVLYIKVMCGNNLCQIFCLIFGHLKTRPLICVSLFLPNY